MDIKMGDTIIVTPHKLSSQRLKRIGIVVEINLVSFTVKYSDGTRERFNRNTYLQWNKLHPAKAEHTHAKGDTDEKRHVL